MGQLPFFPYIFLWINAILMTNKNSEKKNTPTSVKTLPVTPMPGEDVLLFYQTII
jgi:hypothetical protein